MKVVDNNNYKINKKDESEPKEMLKPSQVNLASLVPLYGKRVVESGKLFCRKPQVSVSP